ncbi:MAG: gluconate transporter, partial [Clostridiales bacterium]|nr:gluconate transporter [Clostridiales bacterium]
GIILGAFGTEGYSFMETLSLITAGFGGTLGSLGMPIMLGAILAMGVQDTGAAKSIANFFIKLFHGKNLELAPALTAYIVSIPVFGDITTILCSNIANVLGKRKHISMSTMATFTQTGLNLTHAMVPPTPGILAVSVALAADLGMVISWGIAASIISFILTWLVLKRWCEKEFIPAVPEVTAEIEETNSDKVDDLLIKSEDLPGTFAAFLTILIPVILIAGSSFAGMFISDSTPDDALIRTVVAIFGDKVVALSMGVIYTMFLAMFHKKSVRKSNTDSTGKDPESFREVVLNSWVARGLEVALAALLITGMGGGFSQVIKSFPNINDLATLIQNSGVPGLLIPFLVGAIMMTAVGSMTTAGMTAAAIVLPMMPDLGLSPLAAVLAIGSGTLMGNHYNNSGFWVMGQFFHLNTKQSVKYVTVPCAVASVICLIAVVILNTVGVFG